MEADPLYGRRGRKPIEIDEAVLRELWGTPMRIYQIARILNVGVNLISTKAACLNLPKRKISEIKNAYLHDEAQRRGITLAALKQRLMTAIANDRMVAAILDDGK